MWKLHSLKVQLAVPPEFERDSFILPLFLFTLNEREGQNSKCFFFFFFY